tara:strand:- start:390 stop:2018 length:1629 start_codon:yes stop_codon:yes gene_type:complete
MINTSKFALFLVFGITLIICAWFVNITFLNSFNISLLIFITGLVITAYSIYNLKTNLKIFFTERRIVLILSTVGLIGIFISFSLIANIFSFKIDMTVHNEHSLAPQTIKMLKNIDKNVHISFFHDRGMRETVELYESIAEQNKKITVEFLDPMLNPAQAKLRGIQYAGTALMESENRKVNVIGPTEIDIANGILRVTQGKQLIACFLDGHGEPDPFSLETHDHMEGDSGHSHGLETKIVRHESHGLAKAKNDLEAMNYKIKKISIIKEKNSIDNCKILIVAGPKLKLLQREIELIDSYLYEGGNALLMLDPFTDTGLEKILKNYSILLGDGLVIDEGSHFWADLSSPAISDYNPHEITTKLPLTFFPGARSLMPTELPVPGVSVRPLINSSKNSFTNVSRSKIEYVEGKNEKGPLTLMVFSNFNPSTEQSAFEIMEQLRGEKPNLDQQKPDPNRKASKIVVIGDSDFATNSFYHILGNGTLFLNSINYLTSNENLIGLEPRTFDLPYVNMTNTQIKGTFILSLFLVPTIMAAFGIIIWLRRR